MSAVIEIREPGRPARRLALEPGSLEVGRECSGLVVADTGVSRRHLVLVVAPGGLIVTDLDSTNGTTVNGVSLAPGAEQALRAGDVVRMAATEIAVIETGPAPQPSPAGTPPVLEPTVSDAAPPSAPAPEPTTDKPRPPSAPVPEPATEGPPPPSAPVPEPATEGPPPPAQPAPGPTTEGPPPPAQPAPGPTTDKPRPPSAPAPEPTTEGPPPPSAPAPGPTTEGPPPPSAPVPEPTTEGPRPESTFAPSPVPPAPPEPAEPALQPHRPPAPAVRPALDELAVRETDAAVIRYRPGSAGEAAAPAVAAAVRQARKRLAGLGSEPWGIKPQICLVDPFPDPDRPNQVIAAGTVVDAGRGEIWMVVTAESPAEAPERSLALLFGAALPAAADIGLILEGYGLHLSGAADQDAQLGQLPLPPFAAADGELAPVMAVSFVRFLLGLGPEEQFRRLLSQAQPGRLEAAAADLYGSGLAALEEQWRHKLLAGAPDVKPGEFVRLAVTYLRPHARREVEMFVYMLFSLAFTIAFPFALKRLFDSAIPSGELSRVMGVLAFLGVAFAISLLAGLRRSYLSAYVSSAVVRELRTGMFAKLQSQPTGWFARQQQGDLLSRMLNDVAIVESGLSETLREGVFQLLSLVVALIVLLKLNLVLGLVVAAGAPLIALVYKGMSGGARTRSRAVQERMGGLVSTANENFAAQGVVKAFALEAREKARFGRVCGRLFDSQIRMQLFGGLFGLSVNGVVTALRLFVLGLGSWLVLNGDLSLGGLVAFLSLMGEVINPVATLTGIGQQIQSATGALERVSEVLDAVPEVTDAPDAQAIPDLRREISLEGVGFSYTPERRILDGLDVAIPAGARVAFVGPTGAGKSSVLQLLMRFADPEEGAVKFDGVDLRAATLASLRRQLGVVFQESFLFDDTIRENIAVGKPGATQAEIEAAAKAAELHDFIVELPRGYDTLVGERGGRLSGGQRQRLAIARALVRDPQVLILDEATSALDPRTERLIASTLERVGKGRTTIAVTHRLNSITGYDHIFVIVAGKLAEQGAHAELVGKGGVYAELWAEQTGGAAPAEAPLDAVSALAKVPLFASLGRGELAAAAARLRPADLPAGERLAEGGGRLVLLRRGRARVLIPGLPGGDREADLESVATLGPGDAFGVAALLGQPAGAVLEADGAAGLLLLDDEAVAALAALHPAVAAALEGARTAAPAPAPAGGRRLTRMTMGPGARLSAVAPVVAGPGPDQVRRASGTFGAVGR